MTDEWETTHFGGLSHDGTADTDSDGITDLQEYQNNTDPNDSDSDDDGMPDGWEVDNGLNPNVDDATADPDGDKFTNGREYQDQTDPNNSESHLILADITGRIPDTGQITCYDDSDEITCPQEGESFYGQDANYTINPSSYIKIDAQGNYLPDSAPVWAMVRDNVTGLSWEVKTDDGSIHDKDDTYTWCDSNPDTNGGDAGTCGERTDTEDFINALNAEDFGGFSDWRLPSREELRSIVNYGRYNRAINTAYLPNTVASLYWSSTTLASATDYAWRVNFINGHDYNYNKSSSHYVRAVRGGQSGSFDHFIINGDGTVTDNTTGLMWQQVATTNSMNWQSGLSYCEDLNLGGYADWRLPNIKELASLADLSRYDPAIDTDYFPDTLASNYWSSTAYASSIDGAWHVFFGNGDDRYGGKSYSYYVRAVRGGQNRIEGNLYIANPAQASKWNAYETMPVTWETQNITGNVKISLSRDGGIAFETIEESTENDGTYAWTVAGPLSDNCMLKIEPIDNPSKGTTQGLFAITYGLSDGLVAYYPFNGNANDESGNGSNMENNGGTLVEGKLGMGLQFDGVDDYGRIPNSASINTNAFSVAFWWYFHEINLPNVDDAYTLIQKLERDYNLQYFANASSPYTAATLRAMIGGAIEDGTLESQELQTGQWYHIAMTYDQSVLTLYFDGAWLDSVTTSASANTGAGDIIVGKTRVTNRYVNAIIDELHIYNRALTADEVRALSEPLVDLDNGLIAYYPFNGNANDESGNGHDGTVNGAILTSDRFGNESSAYDFNGADNNIAVVDSDGLSLGIFTISVWFSWKSEHPIHNYRTIIAKGHDPEGFHQNFMIYIYDLTKTISARVGHDNTQETTATSFYSKVDVSDNSMHHAVLVFDSDNGTGDLFIDGVSRDPKSGLLPAYTNVNADISIGVWAYNVGLYGAWDGIIDDIRIYNRILSESEVQELYNLEASSTENHSPNTPSSPIPGNDTTDISTQPSISWSAGDADTGDTVTYDIYFGITDPPPQVTTDQSETIYDPGTLEYNETYYWKIVARDNHGAETIGPVWSFTAIDQPDVTAPTPPSNLQSDPAKENESSDNTIQVSWTAGTDPGGTGVAGYSIVWDTNALTDPDTTMETTDTSTIGSPLVDGDTHYFHIRAVDNAGNVSTTIHLGPFYIKTTQPDATAYPAGGQFYSNVTIHLEANAETANVHYTLNGQDPTKDSYLYVDGIYVEQSTVLKFITVDSSGSIIGPIHEETYMIDKTIQPVVDPEDNTLEGNNPLPTFVWQLVSGAQYYILEFATNANFDSLVQIDGLTETSYTPTEYLSTGGLWYWRIGAVDAAGNLSEWSTHQYNYIDDDSIRKAIVIAGTGPNSGNALWSATVACTDMAFDTLFNRGYRTDRIKYLSHETYSENSDVDELATNVNLQNAITQWAVDADEFVLYLNGHGRTGTFTIGENESLVASNLDDWLDTLQYQRNIKVIVVYEACHSGSFLAPLGKTGDQERIVITSSDADQRAWLVTDGTVSFSWPFWTRTSAGFDLGDAFVNAANSIPRQYGQTPMVDADGDGIANEKSDKLAASNTSIGFDMVSAAEFPDIVSASPTQNLIDETSAAIFVEGVTGATAIRKVWATVLRPDFDPGSPDDPVTYLPEVELTHVGNDRYEGSYSNLDKDGRYIVTVYAKDSDELISEPMEIRVVKNAVIGDINGDSNVNLTDFILALQVSSDSNPQDLIADYAVSGADVDGDDKIRMAEVIYILQKIAGLRN